MFHIEEHTWRIQVVGHETFFRICHVELALAFRSVYPKLVLEGITHAEALGQPYAQYAVIHVGGMKCIFSVADKNLTNMGKTVEIVFHTLYPYHCLAVVIHGECHVFYRLCCHFHFRE